MKKLYEVTIGMMIMAEDEEDALFQARMADIGACNVEVVEAASILPGWSDAIPFGAEDDRICKELLK